MTVLAAVKMALRVSTDAYDNELESLISSAVLDLRIAGITFPAFSDEATYTPGDRVCHDSVFYICVTAVSDPGEWDSSAWAEDSLLLTAIKTYCRVHFGSPADYDKLKSAYDEQKSQLMIACRYTNYADYGICLSSNDGEL